MVLSVRSLDQQHHLGICWKHRSSGPFLDLLLITNSGTEPLHLRVNDPFRRFSDVWELVLWKHSGQCHGWNSCCWVRETKHGSVDDKIPCLWSPRPRMIEARGLAPIGGRKKLTRSEDGAPRCSVSWDGCWWQRLVQFVKILSYSLRIYALSSVLYFSQAVKSKMRSHSLFFKIRFLII